VRPVRPVRLTHRKSNKPFADEAGRWREGFWGVGGGGCLRHLEAKGPRPMHTDAACGVRTYWRRPFHFQTE